MAKPTGKQIGKEFLEQLLHDWMEPLAKFLVKHGVRVDQPWEKLLLALSPLISAYITATFKQQIDAETIVGWFAEISEELVMELKQELDRASREAGAPSAKEKAATPAFVPKRLMLCDAYPGVIYLWACPANHHSTVTIEDVNAGNNKKQKSARTTVRDDCRLITTEHASALMEKAGRTPSSSDEGLNAVCICETEVVAEITRFREEKAKAEKAKVDASKPKDPPVYSNEEIRTGIRVTAGAVGKALGSVGKGFAGTINVVADGIVAAAERGETLVRHLPGELKSLDRKVANHAQRVEDEQGRLLKIERFTRSNKVMDRTGFKGWVLNNNIDITGLAIAAVPQRFMSGERR